MDGMMPGVIGGVIGAMIVLVVFTIRGSSRKPEEALAAPPTDLVALRVSQSSEAIIRAISELAAADKLTLDYQHPQGDLLIFGAKPNVWANHFGYWLYIYLKPVSPGITDVSIGIKTKSYQFAFALNRLRDKFIDRARKSISVIA